MPKIYLIRHAETQQDTGAEASQWVLSERGEEQVELLSQQSFWAEVKAVISSPERKAIATVQDIAFEKKIPFSTHDCLRELQRTPEYIADYDARVLEVFEQPARSIGGWERAADAQARIMRCVEELIAAHAEAPIAICSHGMALALLLAAMYNEMGYVYDYWQALGFASVTLAEREQ